MKTNQKAVIVALVALSIVIVVSTEFTHADNSNTPIFLGDDTYEFAHKQFKANSECELMVLQYVTTQPYDYKSKVPALMHFTKNLCDAETMPIKDTCPSWVNKNLGFCENITE